MPRLTATAPAAVLVLLLNGTPALADVTADEVWAEIRDMMRSYGQTVTVGEETRAGSNLTVRDIVIDMALPDGSTSASLDQVIFVERGDGTVEIVVSPEYRIVSSTRPSEGEAVDMRMVMTHDNLSMVVSGDATAKTYDFEADAVTLAMSEMAVEGETVPVTVTLTAEAMRGDYELSNQDDGRAFDSTFDADRVTILMQGTDPDNGGTFLFDVDIASVASTSDGFLPRDITMENVSAALRAGLRAVGDMTYQTSTFKFAVDADGSQTEGSGSSAAGSLAFQLNETTLGYSTSGTDIDIRMRSSDLPLPELSVAMAEASTKFEMPVTATDAPQDFALATAMRDLTVSDSIWAIFDPMGNLPRDPATLAFDIVGKAKWLIDILDPDAAADVSTTPGEVNEVTLKDLELSVAGAELTGTGAFTFDNTDLTTFDGMPAPDGSVDLRLEGGNGLLDKLIAMGFVPEEQAMGIRMMSGLFARPGDGDDTLVSKIEVKPTGEIIANGQRLK